MWEDKDPVSAVFLSNEVSERNDISFCDGNLHIENTSHYNVLVCLFANFWLLVIINYFSFQMFCFFQYLGLWGQIWKQDWTKVYVRGGMVHVFLKLSMPLKFLFGIQKVHLGKNNCILSVTN